MDDRKFRNAMGNFATGVIVYYNRGEWGHSRHDCKRFHVGVTRSKIGGHLD